MNICFKGEGESQGVRPPLQGAKAATCVVLLLLVAWMCSMSLCLLEFPFIFALEMG